MSSSQLRRASNNHEAPAADDSPPEAQQAGGPRHTRRGSFMASVLQSPQRALSFFMRRGAGNTRTNDYVGDAQVDTRSSVTREDVRRRRQELRISNHHHHDGSVDGHQDFEAEPAESSGPVMRGWACCWNACVNARKRMYYANALIHSKGWRCLLVAASLVLLFGAQARTLFFDDRFDYAFDGIFSFTFCFYLVDLLVRMDCEPNYFQLRIMGCSRQTARMIGKGTFTGDESGAVQIPSFLFFCEAISALALLYEISFIHQDAFDEMSIEIELDAFGAVIDGGDIYSRSPVEFNDVDLIFTIAKTARVARFIRSTAAIKLSSRVNWYWFYNLVDPFWCAGMLFGNCRKSKDGDTNEEAGTGDSASNLGGNGTQNSSSNVQSGNNGGTLLRNDWAGVGLGVLAAVQAQQRARELAAAQERFGIVKRVLRKIGLMRRDDKEWRRILAATKIQRAWRKAKYHMEGAHEFSSSTNDYAFSGGRHSFSPLDKFRLRSHAGDSHHRHSSARHHHHHHHHHGTHRMSNLARSMTLARSRRVPANGENAAGTSKSRSESQVGSAMRELTGQRVACGIILALFLTVIFTYTEEDVTRPTAMIVLHNQTANPAFAGKAIEAARLSSVPDLLCYNFANGTNATFTPRFGEKGGRRDSERLRVRVDDVFGNKTEGLFSFRDEARQQAWVSTGATLCMILVWFFGVTAFSGPVMVLVVIPIERMVRLLGMLTLDPLGYQSTSRYRKFVAEEDEITKNTRWTKEILRGMETSFLMLTILRIGSLMKVGFGSAGVEIIRNNLEKSQSKNTLILSEKGSTVSCIFLFCDIRQFTDATECLQEEVFVFVNRIAAVVHSICHAYGGSANKNIGDAFLVSWRLEEEGGDTFVAKHNQADKALLSVVKICMALHHDSHYIETMSDVARGKLLAKLSKRKGPVVQLGFGLHAGKAVQGAIGSQRKIDATYVSEAVERAEFLESSTKKYGVKMLMSDNFHRLLHPNNQRRCRKLDHILIRNEEDETDDDPTSGDFMELFTFDMDIDALWRNVKPNSAKTEEGSSDVPERGLQRDGRTQTSGRQLSDRQNRGRTNTKRRSVRIGPGGNRAQPQPADASDELSEPGMTGGATSSHSREDVVTQAVDQQHVAPELVLPSGPALYNASVWLSEDVRRIRNVYTDGIFFHYYNSGLQSFYSKDWEHAKQCFTTVLKNMKNGVEDGPSKYFLKQIEEHNGKPPRDFLGYGIA